MRSLEGLDSRLCEAAEVAGYVLWSKELLRNEELLEDGDISASHAEGEGA